MMGKEKSLYL